MEGKALRGDAYVHTYDIRTGSEHTHGGKVMAIFTTERRHKKFSVPVIAFGRWSSSHCRLCDEVREFQNSFPEGGRWAKDRGVYRKGHGTDASNEKAARRQRGTMR